MKKFTGNERKGSVFVEIMVVVVIIILFVTLRVSAAPYNGQRRHVTVVNIMVLENTLNHYYKDNGFYPSTEQGLEALTRPTSNMQAENHDERIYIIKIPPDAWGNPFIYRRHGEKGPIDIISCGPDGIEGTEDDITNHNKNTISLP